MRIVDARVIRLELELSEPYTIAYDTYDRAVNLVLRVEDEDGTFGQGCAAPAPEVTGETPEACEHQLRRAAERLAGGDSPASMDAPTAASAPAAAAALEMALLDLRARRLGAPVAALLGTLAPDAATSMTLGIMPTEEMVARASAHVGRGFAALKVKGGRSVSQDIERLFALRAALGPRIELRFDANQGYGVAEALELAAAAAELGVSLLEQPTPAEAPEALSEVRAGLRKMRDRGLGPPLLMADESATDLRSAARLLLDERVDALNIKLMKIGGIGPAQALDRLAEASGVATMVSCMDEAALAIAAGLQFALASANVRWVDLDGHLDLIDDPTAPAVRLREGRLSPGAGPGLGSPDLLG